MRVRRSTRDRVAALGARTGERADAVVDEALSLYEAELFWADWDRTHARASAEQTAEDAAEVEAWDRASAADLLDRERVDERAARADG